MAHNLTRSLGWLGIAVAGGVLAAIGTVVSRPASGVLIILGVMVGLAGIVGARWHTDWYDFDEHRQDRGR